MRADGRADRRDILTGGTAPEKTGFFRREEQPEEFFHRLRWGVAPSRHGGAGRRPVGYTDGLET